MIAYMLINAFIKSTTSLEDLKKCSLFMQNLCCLREIGPDTVHISHLTFCSHRSKLPH